MTKDKLIRSLNGRKLFEGKVEHIKEWSEILIVRKDPMGYYVAWKDKVGPVANTPNFDNWLEAKEYLKENWKRLFDEEFERQVLIGPEGSEVDNSTEDSSAVEGN